MGNAADPRERIDVRLDSGEREGLTGTAPANLYRRAGPREQITIAPDFRPDEAQPAWRHDFPVDWPQDQYVERRDFMKFLVLTSGAFAAGQLWIAAEDWRRQQRGQPAPMRIAGVDDLAVGAALVFQYPDPSEPCLLVRLAPTEFVAFGQKCTHLSCAVIPRPEEGIFHCPCHEGRFAIRTGAPLAGPPRRPLTRVTLEVRDGAIYATGVEERTV